MLLGVVRWREWGVGCPTKSGDSVFGGGIEMLLLKKAKSILSCKEKL